MIYLRVNLHVNILRAGEIYPTQRGLTDEHYDISLRVGEDKKYTLPFAISAILVYTYNTFPCNDNKRA